MIVKQGNLNGERVRYLDGSIGMCVWYPISDKDDNAGICFDFRDEDAQDMWILIDRLMNTEPAILEPDPEEKDVITWRQHVPAKWILPVIHEIGWKLVGV